MGHSSSVVGVLKKLEEIKTEEHKKTDKRQDEHNIIRTHMMYLGCCQY